MATSQDKRFIGGGLRTSSAAAPLRLDHGYFENDARPMLGAILVKKGWITHDRLDAGLAEARASGMRLGETLLMRGWLFEPELASALAEQFGLRYVDLDPGDVDQDAIERILGRSIELVVGERSAIQEAWRYTPSGAA